MRFVSIQDNRRKWPVHIIGLREGQTAVSVVERFQRNLAAMTPGGLNGVMWRVLESRDVVAAMVETAPARAGCSPCGAAESDDLGSIDHLDDPHTCGLH